jgi:hypothetical protein
MLISPAFPVSPPLFPISTILEVIELGINRTTSCIDFLPKPSTFIKSVTSILISPPSVLPVTLFSIVAPLVIVRF